MRLIVGRIVLAVATVAGLVVVHSHILHSPPPVWVGASASAAFLFGLGGMRHPWFFLAIVVALIVVLPTVYDSSAHDLFMGCIQLS